MVFKITEIVHTYESCITIERVDWFLWEGEEDAPKPQSLQEAISMGLSPPYTSPNGPTHFDVVVDCQRGWNLRQTCKTITHALSLSKRLANGFQIVDEGKIMLVANASVWWRVYAYSNDLAIMSWMRQKHNVASSFEGLGTILQDWDIKDENQMAKWGRAVFESDNEENLVKFLEVVADATQRAERTIIDPKIFVAHVTNNLPH